jgi:hypothetical protein
MSWRIIASFSDWINYQMDVRKHMPDASRSWLLNGPKAYPAMVPDEPWRLIGEDPMLPLLTVEDAKRLIEKAGR